MGLGIVSEYSRSLMPSPPQKITTFTSAPFSSPPLGGCAQGRRRCREVLLEPGLAAEVPVLLGAQLVGDPSFGQLDVAVRQHLVLGDVAPQPATLDQTLGKVPDRKSTRLNSSTIRSRMPS